MTKLLRKLRRWAAPSVGVTLTLATTDELLDALAERREISVLNVPSQTLTLATTNELLEELSKRKEIRVVEVPPPTEYMCNVKGPAVVMIYKKEKK